MLRNFCRLLCVIVYLPLTVALINYVVFRALRADATVATSHTVTLRSNCNVRESASVSATIVQVAMKGDKVNVVSHTGKWSKTSTGWIHNICIAK